MLPYFGEYLIAILRDMHIIYRIRKYDTKHQIERLAKKGKNPEKIEKLQIKLEKIEEKFEIYKEKSKKRQENPYKIRIQKRDAVKWLFLIAIICLAMGLLTPIGDEPYTHIFKLLAGTTTDSISEHQPLVLKGHTDAIIFITMLLGILIFTETKISLKDLFMLGGLLVLTFSARRQFSLLSSVRNVFYSNTCK